MVTIKTGADALLEYLQQHGEVPLVQAAKSLDQPVASVEAWARFLEEEGLVRFKYTLTSVNLLSVQRTAVQMAEDIVRSEEVTQKAQEATSELGKLIEEARRSMREQDLVRAAKAYGQIQAVCEHMGQAEAAAAKPLLDQLSAVSAQFAGTAERMIASLISAVQSRLKKKDVLAARSLFDQARALSGWIPPGEQKSRTQLQVQLIDAQKNLVAGEFEYYSKDFAQLAGLVEKSVAKAEQAVSKGDITSANQHYAQALRYKERLPSGFVERSVEIERKVMELYLKLADINLDVTKSAFSKAVQEIEHAMSTVRDYLGQQRAAEALASYDKVRMLFAELPQGFADRSLPMEQGLLELSKQCMSLHGEAVQRRAKELLDSAEGLLSRTRDALRAGDMELAKSLARELSTLYDSFPAELAQERARLQYTLKTIKQMLEASGAWVI